MRRGFQRIVPGAETAILFIHGIVGTPEHFHAFVSLVPDSVSVCNLLLDGHGGSVKEFSHTSMKKWNAQVDSVVDHLLQTHKQIVIVGHSMGTLFAIRQALTHPARIKALFLLASPVRIRLRWNSVQNSVKTCLGLEQNDPISLAAKDAYGIEPDRRIWRYLGWAPRYLELLAESKKIRKQLPRLNVLCQVFQSGLDEVVSLSSCRLFEGNPNIELTVLKHSSHYYYDSQDLQFLLKRFAEIVS